MSSLKYFTSVRSDDLSSFISSLEEILQREHHSDGTHPIATTGMAGFISPEHIQKIEKMWEFFQRQSSSNETL